MTPLELTTLVNTLANSIACNFSDEETDVVAAVFSQLGDTLITISAQRALCDKINNKQKANCET